jgi:hypothetical protein
VAIFLDEARNKPATLEEIRGFLLAVRDCCLAKAEELKIPGFVSEECAKLAGLDPELLEKEQLNRRVRELISDLSRSDAQDRLHAVFALHDIGAQAKAAVPALVKTLRDPDKEVRQNAAEAQERCGSTEFAQTVLWQTDLTLYASLRIPFTANFTKKAAPRFELGVEVLQTSALPLGDAAGQSLRYYITLCQINDRLHLQVLG